MGKTNLIKFPNLNAELWAQALVKCHEEGDLAAYFQMVGQRYQIRLDQERGIARLEPKPQHKPMLDMLIKASEAKRLQGSKV